MFYTSTNMSPSNSRKAPFHRDFHALLLLAFAWNFVELTIKRSWMPVPIMPVSSETSVLNFRQRPSTPINSVSHFTAIPTGVGDTWLMSSFVPTVHCPSSRYGATLRHAVSSIKAIIAGVANTASVPLPTAAAVFCR